MLGYFILYIYKIMKSSSLIGGIIVIAVVWLGTAFFLLQPEKPADNQIADVVSTEEVDALLAETVVEEVIETIEEETTEEWFVVDENYIAEISDDTLIDTPVDMVWTMYSLSDWNTLWRLWRKVWWEHFWTVLIKQWDLFVNDWQLVWGEFTMDMTTVTATDIDSPDLDWHLKGTDFFDVEQFPEAVFTIAQVTANEDTTLGTHTIVWVLTIKWERSGIRFPANITIDDTAVSAQAKFFVDKNIRKIAEGSPVIDQYMEFNIDLTWNKVS